MYKVALRTQIESIPKGKKVVFISYSWDSEEHKVWVKKLADDLGREEGIYVLCDCYNPLGIDLVDFMRRGIKLSERVLIIGTPKYKAKAESRNGGAAYEDYIINVELYKVIGSAKFIPILREGEDFDAAFCETISVRNGLDMRDDAHYEKKLQELACDILGKPINKRPNVIKEQSNSAQKKNAQPKQDVAEENEHPRLWEKLFKYQELSNEELIEVVTKTCNLIRENKTTTSFVEFMAAIINLCEIHDTMFPLQDDIKEGMQRNIDRYIQQCANQEELYELKRKFSQTAELLSAKVNGSAIQEMIDYFRKQYNEAYAIRKDKMTLFLENMTDESMDSIGEVYAGTVPDHTTPYDMTGIFQNVDIDKMFAAICRLSNAPREKFMHFIESRYLLRNRLMGHCWVAYDEELEPLRNLKKLIDDNIEQFELNDKRSMHRLSEYVGMAIKRCCGETDVLIGF